MSEEYGAVDIRQELPQRLEAVGESSRLKDSPRVIGMKTRRISNSISLGAWLCSLAFGLLGCAAPVVSPVVSPDRSSIEGLGGIGSFTWRGIVEVTGGVSGFGTSNLATVLTAQSQGRESEEVQNSEVFETFAREFAQQFSSVSTASVRQLDKSKYILAGKDNERRVDVAATAKAEGFDAILESTVWPTLHRWPWPSNHSNQLKIDFKLQRLSDFKLLWQDSLTIEAAENKDWNDLARTAAKLAAEKYGKTNK